MRVCCSETCLLTKWSVVRLARLPRIADERLRACQMSRVWVFGSIHIDIVAFGARHPAIGETVMASGLRLLPGGKGANQAVAARRAGAPTSLVGRLGDDAFAGELRGFLSGEDIDLRSTTTVEGTRSGTALIVVAQSDNTIVIVPGSNSRLDARAAETAEITRGDVVVAQFETPQDATIAAFERAHGIGALTVLNPAPAMTPKDGLLELSDVIVVNETELRTLSREPDAGAIIGARAAFVAAEDLRLRRDQTVVVTLGAGGVIALTPNGPVELEARAVIVTDTTGAGDCFVGNLAASLCFGETIASALETANLAASLCVQKVGAAVSMPTAEMLREAWY